MLRVSEQIFFQLNKEYHEVTLKDNIYCVISHTRETILEFIRDYLKVNNLEKFYYRDFSDIDIYEDFLEFLIRKKPNIVDKKLTRKVGSFAGCLHTFLNKRLNIFSKRTNPKKSKYLPEFVSIQDCWSELLRLESIDNRYFKLDEIVENEIERLYNNNDYLCGNYMDYNSAMFIAMFLGTLNVEYKESMLYFPYNPKEYMINALACKFTDISRRVEHRINV